MFDPIFLNYHLYPGHPEDPRRILYIQKEFEKRGLALLFKKIDSKIKVYEWIKTIHTEEHINSIKKNYKVAFKVAEAAVKAVLSSVDSVMSQQKKNIFCAIRPPGHHALNTGKEEGFCYFNNIAIAAKYLQIKYRLNKILIVDWDYHHGNSTEFFFYDDPSVLFFSTHDQFSYPLTGSPKRTGSGKGKGFNINVHLPCGTDDELIIEKFKKILIPAAETFKPEIVLLSSGFDSRKDDTLGCFDISDQGFKNLTKIVMNIANKHSNDRLVSLLEGGYNLIGNAKAAASHVETLINYKVNE